MWSPTHVQVTVQRAKGLLTKGKNGTNNCFVTIALGKDKYQTSIREKASQNVEWHEECELAIPDKGNTAELILTCLHHNSLGIDEFLGQITLPLRDMDAYDAPRSKWFKLQSKPGQEKKDKERGELEVRINFTVKAGSLSDLSKKEKNKSSLSQLASSVGGSLLSIGTLEKKKGIKKIATSIGSKLHLTGKKKNKKGGDGDVDSESFTGSMASIGTPNNSLGGSRKWNGRSYVGNQDPGVIEDDDEFVFDKLSHKSSGSSLNITRGHNDYNHRIPSPIILKDEDRNSSKLPSPPAKPPRNASDQKLDEWETKLYGNHLDIGSTDSLKRRSWGNNRIPLNTTDENEEGYEDVKLSSSNNNNSIDINTNETVNDYDVSPKIGGKSHQRNDVIMEKIPEVILNKEITEKIYEEKPVSPKIAVTNTEVIEKKETKLEKLLNKSPLMRTQSREVLDNFDQNSNKKPAVNSKIRPRALPRSDTISVFTDDVIQSPEDAKEIREKLKKDQKEISEKTEKIEKKHRFGKLKYFVKRGESKSDLIDENGFHGERHNPIGHENFNENENSLSELSPELLNKYEGKSREDIILIADSFEKEMIMERSRVKELEEYLDNLLLRVMETHPKILQNPYRTTSTKSG